MDLKILYEDEHILALDKPSGLLVHPDGRSTELTLVDWLQTNRPEIENVGEEEILQNGEKVKRPGMVHRLDRDTSGVIIVCKTPKSFEFVKGQFKDRKVDKIYNCLVWGNFAPEFVGVSRMIDFPIGRSAADFRRWSAEKGAKGELRESKTEYTVLGQNAEFAYVEARPKTGRTHQIRVHMKALSHPVVCDKLYAPNKECTTDTCIGFNRLALHALSIKLELPSGVHIKIESELPPEFENAKLAMVR